MSKVNSGVVRGSAGCFLDPPTYPTHNWHVATDTQRKRDDWGSCSLTYAVECDWIDATVRADAQRLLDDWKRPSIDNPDIVDWVRQVLGYFRGCYRNDSMPDPACWHASNLLIDQNRNPLDFVDTHAGVRLVRMFYPEFAPTSDDFSNAYWGRKQS